MQVCASVLGGDNGLRTRARERQSTRSRQRRYSLAERHDVGAAASPTPRAHQPVPKTSRPGIHLDTPTRVHVLRDIQLLDAGCGRVRIPARLHSFDTSEHHNRRGTR